MRVGEGDGEKLEVASSNRERYRKIYRKRGHFKRIRVELESLEYPECEKRHSLTTSQREKLKPHLIIF